MTAEEKVLVLAKALEDIRELTFQPTSKYSPTEQRRATPAEKEYAWAMIQAVAAEALRAVG